MACDNRPPTHAVGPVMTWLLTLMVMAPAFGVDRHLNVGSGLWNTSTSWNPASVPGPSDHAIVDYFNGSPGLARISASASPVTAVTIANGGTVTV